MELANYHKDFVTLVTKMEVARNLYMTATKDTESARLQEWKALKGEFLRFVCAKPQPAASVS